MTELQIAVALFIVVFVLNVLPAFAPPTWTTMSFIGLAIPDNNFILLSIVAAIAATSGRIVLAKLSRVLVRRRLLRDEARRNVDAIRMGMERRPALTFSAFLGYALSPLPSNYLFIAYGLTSLPIAFLSLPFFVGRLASYAIWIRTASTVGDWLDVDWFESAPYFVAYYLSSQLLLIPMIYAFTRLDWRALFGDGRLKWLQRSQLGDDRRPLDEPDRP
jgi:membrane protein YqaA with SNARE-associated domain